MNEVQKQIAETEAKLARLKEKSRKLENGQKIIIGGAMLAEAKDNREFAIQLVKVLESRVTRKTDVDRIASVIDHLKKQISENTSYPNQLTQEQAINRDVTPTRHHR